MNEKILSQQRLGELLGEEIGIRFSGAAVSDWERGKSKIHADDRVLLVGLVKIFHERGSLSTLDDANAFLESGNYRRLDPDEQKRVFGNPDSNQPSSDAKTIPRFVLASGLFNSPEEFQNWLDAAEDGPSPSWPRVVTAFLRRLSDRLSATKVLRALVWFWIWIIGYALIAPSLRWPFPNGSTAKMSISLYACAALILPLWVAALINTHKNPYWKHKSEISQIVLRLYVHQGAFIGFHLGYFAVLAVNLLLYYFHVRFLPGLEFALLGIPLLMGFISAQVVPYSLWRAYGRLDLADGAIFFVFLFLGPIWGWFFDEFYQILLSRIIGLIVILMALTLLTGAITRRPHGRDKTVNGAKDNNA